MSTHFILRFDDITPGMAWSKFMPLKRRLETIGIKSVLGVVPDCRDTQLMVEPENEAFFDTIRHWAAYGDTIAQHGTYHSYTSTSSGILGINNRSEFAGRPKVEQSELLAKGKRILEAEGVWQPYFMAPAHSFDLDTLEALSQLGFVAVTDGYGFYPYKLANIILVPQLTSFPFNPGFGYVTICLHINNMSQTQIDNLFNFIEKNRKQFASFPQIANDTDNTSNILHTVLRKVSHMALNGKRSLRHWRKASK